MLNVKVMNSLNIFVEEISGPNYSENLPFQNAVKVKYPIRMYMYICMCVCV